MLQAIAGYDPNDPTSLPAPVPDMLKNLYQGIKGVVIGFDEEYARRDVDPETAEAVSNGVKILEDLGAEIVNLHMPDMDQYIEAWSILCSAEAVAAHDATYPSQRKEYGPKFLSWLDRGANVTGAEYVKANNLRATCTGHLRCVFENIDVLACPSVMNPALPVDREEFSKPIPKILDPVRLRFTVPFNFTGAPTLSLPCGMNRDGLPLSLQFVGKHLSEPLLCQVGHAYEQATEWHTKHPNI